jgi:ABC-type multidrug transport system fused ATPase/permease subunit
MNLANRRHYVRREVVSGAEALQYDPRFLVFEFTYGLMFRQQQVELIGTLMGAVDQGHSLCHQLLMGEGKTTVIGPLLAMLLADGKSLVTQVVPAPLLDFSRSVMREKFSAIVRKSIFTFSFDRMSKISEELYSKLEVARDTKAVVCTTPTAIKSFTLKLIELLICVQENHISSTDDDDDLLVTGFALRMLRRFGLKEPRHREYTAEMIADMRHQANVATGRG